MGASQSSQNSTATTNTWDDVNPLSGLGVASLVREVGLSLIPIHLRHTLESVTQIIETITKLRQFDEAPYQSHMIMLVALVRHIQMESQPSSSPTISLEDNRLSFQETGHRSLSSDGPALVMFHQDEKFASLATNIYFASLQPTDSLRANAMEVDQENIIYSWLTDDYEVTTNNFQLTIEFLDWYQLLIPNNFIK